MKIIKDVIKIKLFNKTLFNTVTILFMSLEKKTNKSIADGSDRKITH